MSQLSDVIRSGIRAEDLTGLTPEQQQALEPLLRFVNTGIQGLSQALSGEVSTSNLQVEVQTVPLTSGVPSLVSLKKLTTARGVRSISVGSADGKTQHSLAQPLHLIGTTVPNQVKVLANFADTTATRVPVTFELTPDGNYTALPPRSGTWTAPALLNAWVNFDAAHAAAGFLKDSLGFVHLRGLVKNGAVGATIFTLPAGFRPATGQNFGTIANAGAAEIFGSVFVDTAGNVISEVGGNTYFSLAGMTFDTR